MAEKLTKAERREVAREKARVLREEQEKREKRNKMLMIGGVVVLLVLVAIAVFAIIQNAGRSHLDDVHSPQDTDNRGGISIGESLVAGTENPGVPEVNVYADYTCIYCAQFDELNHESLEEMAAAGEITLTLHPISLIDVRPESYASRAANATATVAQYAPEHVLALNSAFFESYRTLSEIEGATFPNDAEIAEIALEAGVPQDVVDRFADREFEEWVTATTLQFRADGFRGTPAIVVDGTHLDSGEWQDPNYIRAMIEGE